MKNTELKEKWAPFKNDLQKKWGKITDADIREIDGDTERFAERVEKRYGKQQAEVLKWAEDWKASPKKKAAVRD